MNNYKADILLHSSTLAIGENVRVECPCCLGADKTLSITLCDDGELRWQCFRASCELGGAATGQVRRESGTLPVVKRRKVFEGKTIPLTEREKQWISTNWSIESPPYWYHTDSAGGRIAMSIRGPKYEHRGWVLRSINPNSRMKALTYLNDGAQGLAWYKNTSKTGTVLVEDIPSAVRAQPHVNAVALLGTAVGLDKALEIAEYAPKPIIVALDQDAVGLSFFHRRRYKLLWDDVQIISLKKDIKDMAEEDICQLLDTTQQ